MTITETTTIDLVGTRPDSRAVHLVIVDHLDWMDFAAHSRLLQDKINTYRDFVASGQLARMASPPIPLEPEIHIVLKVLHPPTRQGSSLIEAVRRFLSEEGIKFDVEEDLE